MWCSFMQFLIAELPRGISMHILVPSSSLVSLSRRALSCDKLWSVIFHGCFRVFSFPEPFKARLSRWTNNVGRAFTARPFAINSFSVVTFTWDRWPCFRVRTVSIRLARVKRVNNKRLFRIFRRDGTIYWHTSNQ